MRYIEAAGGEDREGARLATNSPFGGEAPPRVRAGIGCREAICGGLRGHLDDDTNIDCVYHGEYHDETSGERLDSDEVEKARCEEIEYFKEVKVKEKVPCSRAMEDREEYHRSQMGRHAKGKREA